METCSARAQQVTWFVITLLLIGGVNFIENSIKTSRQFPEHKQPVCKNPTATDENIMRKGRRSLVIISTLDGMLTALDSDNDGKIIWRLNTGPGGMLSSTISFQEVYRDGKSFRIVPSLDGKLYRYDGESIEQVPFTADSLLHNSVKLSDGIVVTGGKESRTYAIQAQTGKLNYACTLTGCDYNSDQSKTSPNDLLIVRRQTQTIRAVETLDGSEKWNFSVGLNEVVFRPDTYISEDNSDVIANSIQLDFPKGLIVVRDKATLRFQWQKRFGSPICQVWHLHNNHLLPVDLFANHINSDLADQNSVRTLPFALYMGMYRQQLYVQPSLKLRDQSHWDSLAVNMPTKHMKWMPYLTSAPSRTPAIHGSTSKNELIYYLEKTADKSATGFELVVRQDTAIYPYDTGYYLFTGITPLQIGINDTVNDTFDQMLFDYEDSFDQIIIVSNTLWYYWREILGISVTLAIGINIAIGMIRKFFSKPFNQIQPRPNQQMPDKMSLHLNVVSNNVNVTNIVQSKSRHPSSTASETDKGFESRYLADFQPEQRLGKGGFGVVFEATNKLDEGRYAIKRVTLPCRDDAREKVMREVKALAKLDNPGIVRYYNAWIETPPPGWQESQDVAWSAANNDLPSPSLSLPGSSLITTDFDISRNVNCQIARAERYLNELTVNPLRPDGDCSENSLMQLVKSGRWNVDDAADTSNDDSICFLKNASENEESGSFSLPKRTENNSVDSASSRPDEDSYIVFEDSGCAEEVDNRSRSKFFRSGESNDNSCEVGTVKTYSNLMVSVSGENTNERNVNVVANNLRIANKKEVSVPKIYLYIQMQLCQKESLKDWLLNNSCPRNKVEVLDYFDQIVNAVEYVHERGLIHRDLKPSNIFFSLDGVIKVGDFGLATTLNNEIEELANIGGDCGDVNQVTANFSGGYLRRHTEQVGTGLYMSPEQVSGKSYNEKVDIYSLGLIFFELLTPFGTQMERMQVLLNLKKHVFPEEFVKHKSDEFELTQAMLSHEPDKRPSAGEIRCREFLQVYQPNSDVIRQRGNRLNSRTYSHSSASTESASTNSS